jgi:hypothetical protein
VVALSVAVAVAAVVLPRALIPVQLNVAGVDPFRADLLWTLLTTPLSLRRDLNIVFVVATYFLPLLALGGHGRLRSAWASLGEARKTVVLVGAVTLVLTVYGGSDLPRFAAYFVVVQTLVLAAVLRRGASDVEIALTLVAVAVFNRVYLVTLPTEPIDRYLDLYGGYADRLNAATGWRAVELVAWVMAIRLAGAIAGRVSRRSPVSSA